MTDPNPAITAYEAELERARMEMTGDTEQQAGHCWQCGGKRQRGVFRIFVDLGGTERIVHVSCLANARRGSPRFDEPSTPAEAGGQQSAGLASPTSGKQQNYTTMTDTEQQAPGLDWDAASRKMIEQATDVRGTPSNRNVPARVSDYLALGGLWNPESMDHEAVRSLLIDARDVIEIADRELASSQHGYKLLADHAEKQAREVATIRQENERLSGERTRYKYIAGAALNGTDEADKIAAAFPDPYEAFAEAMRIDNEWWNLCLDATVRPLRGEIAALKAKLNKSALVCVEAVEEIDALKLSNEKLLKLLAAIYKYRVQLDDSMVLAIELTLAVESAALAAEPPA